MDAGSANCAWPRRNAARNDSGFSAELAQPTSEPTARRVLGLKNGFARSGALRTATATATCATPHLGFEARRLVVPFDADHRKNDDHGRFRRARHHWLPRGALRWPKIDHRAHVVAPALGGRSPDATPWAI